MPDKLQRHGVHAVFVGPEQALGFDANAQRAERLHKRSGSWAEGDGEDASVAISGRP